MDISDFTIASLDLPGTSTLKDEIFTDDLNDRNSVRYRELEDQFCAQVS